MGGDRIVYTAPSKEFWDVPGVVHRGKVGTYRFFEGRTDSMSYSDMIKTFGIQIPSSLLVWDFIFRVYDIREQNPKEAERLRISLKEGFRRFVATSTIGIYNPSGEEDEVVHGYGSSEQFSFRGDIIGSIGLVTDVPYKKGLEFFFGTDDVGKINRVSQWVNNTDSYLWTLPFKVLEREGRAVWFGASPDKLILNCNKFFSSHSSSFRLFRID